MTPEQFALFARIEQDHWWFVARRQIVARILRKVVPPNQNKTIIDVGCGTGGNIASLAGEYRCVGIDTTPDAIELARKRFGDVHNVHYVLGAFPAGLEGYLQTASAITCMDVIEHVEDDLGFVKMLVDAAPAGSHLLLTVPADMSLWSQHDVTNGHHRRYDRDTFAKVWSGLPVTVRLLSYFNSRLYPVVKAMRWRANRRNASHGADGTDFKQSSRPVNWLLKSVFLGESGKLVKLMDSDREPYRGGVSLIAVLRKSNANVGE
jgi:SAM-dependent methyltransferase